MTLHPMRAEGRTGRRGLFGLWGPKAGRDSFNFAVDVPGVAMRDGEGRSTDGFHEICAWLGEHCTGPYTTRSLMIDGRSAGRTFLFEYAADAELLRARLAGRRIPVDGTPVSSGGGMP